MRDSTPSKARAYTPEQRKLLGKTYRLILSWAKEKRKTHAAQVPTDEIITVGETTLRPSVDVNSQPTQPPS